MIACSHTLTLLNTTSTYSGNVGRLLDLVEVQPQDFCQTISLALPSSTQSDGASLTGVSLIKKEQSCQISTLTSLHRKDQPSLKQSEKNEENLVLFRWPLSELKALNLQSSPRVVDIVAQELDTQNLELE